MSYENLIMYNSAIPSSDFKATKKKGKVEENKGLSFGSFMSQTENIQQ